jgi:hypothetical protein
VNLAGLSRPLKILANFARSRASRRRSVAVVGLWDIGESNFLGAVVSRFHRDMTEMGVAVKHRSWFLQAAPGQRRNNKSHAGLPRIDPSCPTEGCRLQTIGPHHLEAPRWLLVAEHLGPKLARRTPVNSIPTKDGN